MSYKQILVHLDDDRERSDQRTNAALRLARIFSAQLIGAYFVPGIGMTPSLAAMLPGDIVDARMARSGDAQAAAESAFRDAVAGGGAASAEWRAPAGPAVETAVAHARATDLVVVGQAVPDGDDGRFASELIDALVLTSGRPVLVIPYTGIGPTIGENVLIAWDGGHEVSRAIGDALPILQRARSVNVLAANLDESSSASGAQGAARLSAWLAQHGIEIGIVHRESTDIDIGDWLLSRVSDSACDLVVMGGYAHARMREAVLGGMTRSMLEAMTVPVLMAH